MFDSYYFINGTDRLQQIREILPQAMGGWSYFFMTMIIAVLFMAFLNSYGLGEVAGFAAIGVIWFMAAFNWNAVVLSFDFGLFPWNLTISLIAGILTVIYFSFGIAKQMQMY
jgi:hypothetical protein